MSWAKGYDGIAGGANGIDDYEVDVPANLNNVTLTADYLGAATIQGPGDVATVDLEGFLQFYNTGTNQNWTISNLRILDFDLSIGLFWRSGSPSNHFDGTKITNNYIRIATDLKGVLGGPRTSRISVSTWRPAKTRPSPSIPSKSPAMARAILRP